MFVNKFFIIIFFKVNIDALNYFIFDIDYNFESKTLNSFSIKGYSGPKTNKNENGVRYYKFENNNLRVLSDESTVFSEFAQGMLLELDEFMALEKSASPANYSSEYVSAMEEANN